MAGMDFKAPVAKEQEDAAVVAHNTRWGVILFFVYVMFYGGFMALSAFWPEAMSKPFLGGANLAVVYGFALIVGALVLALVYMRRLPQTPIRSERMIHETSCDRRAGLSGLCGRGAGHQLLSRSRAKSASGYFAAGGGIHWAVNGIAFAGDYLSAASFLGICGMIAFFGYDGFLYSIGYLAGWIVALFIIAEPLKRLGRYTFADALDNKFNSRGIKLAAAISTLVVSCFYLIPQMVGAGALVQPLAGVSRITSGVMVVGSVVTLIVILPAWSPRPGCSSSRAACWSCSARS